MDYLLKKTVRDEKESIEITNVHDYVDGLLVSVYEYILQNHLDDPQNPIYNKYKEFQIRCVKPVSFATKEERDKIKKDLEDWCKENNIPASLCSRRSSASIMGDVYRRDRCRGYRGRWR